MGSRPKPRPKLTPETRHLTSNIRILPSVFYSLPAAAKPLGEDGFPDLCNPEPLNPEPQVTLHI